MSKITIIDQIRHLLAQSPPLSITTTREIFTSLSSSIPGLLNHTVREAVQKISLGSGTSKRRKTQIYFAIYLTIPEMKGALGRDDIILTLPGIEKKFIEHMSTSYINDTKKKLFPYYGKEPIEYWVQSAQLRSVDVITSKEKKAVISRDNGNCRICKAIYNAYTQSGITLPNNLQWIKQPVEKPRICHIISRRAVFWNTIEKVHFEDKVEIFTIQGVNLFKSALMNNYMHSSSKYMVYLCRKHDNLVQDALKA